MGLLVECPECKKRNSAQGESLQVWLCPGEVFGAGLLD